MTTYRLFESGVTIASGPSAPASYGGNITVGVTFGVTSVSWFEGYWWWVCPSGQSTAPQTFALWQIYDSSADGVVIKGSVVTSGTLTAGQWNWVPLPSPIPLSITNDPTQPVGDGAAVYLATTGLSGSFPITNGDFSPSGNYKNGIINGPLVAYTDAGGAQKSPLGTNGTAQGQFATAGTDPSVYKPNNNSATSSNFWVDVQVSDTAPANYTGSYRLWPNLPMLYHQDPPDADTLKQTMGTQFVLSETCTLTAVWIYSPTWATVVPAGLPASTQVWDATTGQVVAQTTTANWSGPAGSGWVYDSYTSQNITLQANKPYIATVYYPGVGNGNSPQGGFYAENKGYFHNAYKPSGATSSVTGPGYKGITNGPLSSPPLTSTYNFPNLGNTCYIVNPSGTSGPLFPTNWDDKSGYLANTGWGDDGETRWVDVEVTAGGASTPPPPPPKASGVPLTFFP